jgi:hypothetical protein
MTKVSPDASYDPCIYHLHRGKKVMWDPVHIIPSPWGDSVKILLNIHSIILYNLYQASIYVL